MSAAIDQVAAFVTKAGTAGNTLSITFGTNPAVGSTIIVPISLYDIALGQNDYVSVTDNQGNGTYSSITQAADPSLNAQAHIAYVKCNNSSGTFTITFTFSGTDTNMYMHMGAFSVVQISDAVDKQNKGTFGVSSTSASVNTGTTSSANEFLVALLHATANDPDINTVQTQSGWNGTPVYVEDDAQTVTGFRVDWRYVTAIGDYQSAWTFDPSSGAYIIASFAETAPPVTVQDDLMGAMCGV